MKSLQDLIDSKSNLVDYFYNDTVSQFHRSRTDLFSSLGLIQREYSNWRDEHRAARESCLIVNQSHHMPVLYVRGPDARRMLNYLSPCSFENLRTDGAKQYFAVTPRGHHIGDCVMNWYGDDKGFELISGMPLLNWVRYHAETGNYDVELEFDPTTPYHPTGQRTKFRFQVEGPTARQVLEDAAGGAWPELKFFRSAMVNIAGVEVHALRHSMGSVGGAELAGPYDQLERVRDALLAAGEKNGIVQGGTITYFSNGSVSGWVPYPLPGIYTGDELKAYREWLPAEGWEANMQLGGSMVSGNIEDYYWTPSALGYDRFVKFDHDFIGREALEAAQDKPRRVRRVLQWHPDDLARVFSSQFGEGDAFKAIDLPTPMYGWPQADEVRTTDGKLVGMSQYCAYVLNEHDLISTSQIDEEYAAPGTELVMTWGEPGGGSRKPHVERHVQTTIRVTVHEAPYAKVAKQLQRAAL
ncbi:glycine cleavage system protein T [Sphingomonas sp. Root710]|uniref:aminomethyltransferase family protein n=1 Tax=Sphingomonas sp. Root710 TaxID=1736594 RepID=UPI0006FDDF1E|nr:aminomethyltransferase family protein [Sphingomonas sp. Root710]KRB85480.1 glycine cleavage system protein T [Sphingomonas sp. Root710]